MYQAAFAAGAATAMIAVDTRSVRADRTGARWSTDTIWRSPGGSGSASTPAVPVRRRVGRGDERDRRARDQHRRARILDVPRQRLAERVVETVDGFRAHAE